MLLTVGGGFVLVVDDNESHCYAMQRILETAGYDVAVSHTGADAVAITLALAPDAVLLDINLPDMNGIEVCRRLRANSKSHVVPVIFHSATHATDVWRTRAEAVGATEFLTYPIEREHLLTVIAGVVAKRRTRR